MPSLRSLFTSVLINNLSAALYLLDLLAIGWQSAVKFSNKEGGSTANVPKADKMDIMGGGSPSTVPKVDIMGGLSPPYFMVISLCWFRKEIPKIIGTHALGRTVNLVFG